MAESDEQYDALGAIYERAKHVPTGLAERATLLSAVGDLRGKSVLDVACGTGYEITPTGPMNLKQPVTVHVLGDPPFDFDSFYWERGVFDGALRKCPSFGVLTALRAAS